jgi:hypothetical protein
MLGRTLLAGFAIVISRVKRSLRAQYPEGEPDNPLDIFEELGIAETRVGRWQRPSVLSERGLLRVSYPLSGAIGKFAMSYAKQTELDYKAFVKSRRMGRIEVAMWASPLNWLVFP